MAGTQSFEWDFGLPVSDSPILQVSIYGHVDLGTFHARYGPHLTREIEKHTIVGLLVDGTLMTGFDVQVPKAHATLLDMVHSNVHAVALTTTSTTARFGVAAASMALRQPLRAFPTNGAALSWLDERFRAAGSAR